MSIEMENPKTVLEKIDAARNHLAQARLAFWVNDKKKVESDLDRADELLFSAVEQLQGEA